MASDNFEFKLVGGVKPFIGYISAADRTFVQPGALIKGSKNVYKKNTGTIAIRPGLKRRGVADTTLAGVVSSYVWQTSGGIERPLKVANNKLQVESDIVTPGSPIWYDLYITATLASPAASLTRFVFDAWWKDVEKKDRLLMARGDSSMLHWSGGLALVSAGTALVAGGISALSVVSGGSGYVVGDQLTVVSGSGMGSIIEVVTVAAGVIATIKIVNTGSAYGTGATTSNPVSTSGTGATFNITATASYASITKQGTESWAELGFASYIDAEKKVIINGAEYAYLYGESTTTINGIVLDASAATNGSVAIQSVMVATKTPASGYTLDFLKVLGNQVLTGSETSKVMWLSADDNFDDYTNSGDLITGDPDFVILDTPPNGIAAKAGSFYVAAGNADWYIITPNTPAPVSLPISGGSRRYVITKVEKKAGAGLTSAYAHEFIDVEGDDIVYLSKDQQVRVFGVFRNFSSPRYPTISQQVSRELALEDFTGGHLRCIGDFVHLTAPNNGRDWMYQTRQTITPQGNVVAERLWHPPQIRNVSRFEVIDGVTYGHSNTSPQIYQIWDTNQWHDDSPSGESIPYDCAIFIAYQNGGRRQGKIAFDKIYIEGYMTPGAEVLGNAFYEYQGSHSMTAFTVNSATVAADFYVSESDPSLGDSTPGDNPQGDGLTPDPDEQELLPKFRRICKVPVINAFEYAIELYSLSADARWEIITLGTNYVKSPQQATVLAKSG